jgi:hypothetical protein
MDFRVFPAITEVCLMCEESHQFIAVEKAVELRGFVIVFVDFGQAIRELVVAGEDRMVSGEGFELTFWEDLSEGFLSIREEAVIVV